MEQEENPLEALILEVVYELQQTCKRLNMEQEVAKHVELVTEVLRTTMKGFDFPASAMKKLQTRTNETILKTIDKLVAERKLIKTECINQYTYKLWKNAK